MPVERIGIVGEFTPSTLPNPIQNLISTGLTTITQDGSVHPGLSSWWEASESGKQYIFHLRTDAVWHNGKPVTAEDVNYNIKNVSITPVNAQTVKMVLESPYSPLPALVAKPIFRDGLIGFGTHKVDRLQLKGDKVRLLRLTPVEKQDTHPVKEYIFYQTETAAQIGYKLGEIDILEDIANPSEFVSWKNTQLSENIKYNRIVTVFFNTKDQLLSEKSVRQALAYAMPEFPEIQAISPISKLSWAFSEKVKVYDANPSQAEKLLNTVKISSDSAHLTLVTFAPYLDTAQAIANNWTRLGINTEVKVENTVPSGFQAVLTAIDVPPDPDQYPYWHSTQTQTNISSYVNPKIDKLLEDGRQVMDPETRKSTYADFARRLVDDAPAVFLYYAKTYTILRK